MVFSPAFVAMKNACCAAGASPNTAPIDYEKTVLCDPAGARVLVISAIDPLTGIPTPAGYNLDGTAYAGALSALVACDTPEIESDPVEMCDGGTIPFLRWFVKSNGVITGAFDTSIAGLPYTPAGVTSVGVCVPAKKAVFAMNSGTLPGGTLFDLAASVTSGRVVEGYTISFVESDGTIDGVATPRSSPSWAANESSHITNLPTEISSAGRFFIHWTERLV